MKKNQTSNFNDKLDKTMRMMIKIQNQKILTKYDKENDNNNNHNNNIGDI